MKVFEVMALIEYIYRLELTGKEIVPKRLLTVMYELHGNAYVFDQMIAALRKAKLCTITQTAISLTDKGRSLGSTIHLLRQEIEE